MFGDYYSDYTAVLVATVAGTGLVLVSFLISQIVAPKARSVLKDIPYECGIEPIGDRCGLTDPVPAASEVYVTDVWLW